MNYSDETRFAIYHQCPHLTAMQIGDVLRALESTAEQKALRADAERYRCLRGHFGIAVPDNEGTVIWLPAEIDEAIDKARSARG